MATLYEAGRRTYEVHNAPILGSGVGLLFLSMDNDSLCWFTGNGAVVYKSKNIGHKAFNTLQSWRYRIVQENNT